VDKKFIVDGHWPAISMQPAATVCDEPSAESLWGDLAGLNLAGYDDWDDEELHKVDVEAVVAQLVSCGSLWPACPSSPAYGRWAGGTAAP